MNLFQEQQNEFISRHIGPSENDEFSMLKTIGCSSMNELIDKTIPSSIRLASAVNVGNGMSENQYLENLKKIAQQNKVFKSYIGKGYYNTYTPSVILRNVFENPGWYTQYTPYQAEIAQGRLECLLNYQTMVSDLTGLPIANASLLDEGTAAAEAMAMLFNHKNKNTDAVTSPRFFVDSAVFEQSKQILITRAKPLGIELVFGDYKNVLLDETFFGVLVQYPNNNGSIEDYRSFTEKAHQANAMVIMATDLLALCLLTPPGELGADVAIGSAQRFGVPVGFGGPHAAFFATKDEFKRNIPGRIIGISIDSNGNRCLRMALQTREQHIRREKATSNICTAQALLANISAMYAIYHGADGLKKIAKRTSLLTQMLTHKLKALGISNKNDFYFDTICIETENTTSLKGLSESKAVNFGYEGNHVFISLDETTTLNDIDTIVGIFEEFTGKKLSANEDAPSTLSNIPTNLTRTSPY